MTTAPKKLELRACRKIELREDGDGLPAGVVGRLTGYAAVFNRDSQEFDGWEKPWVERVAPGAFTRTLAEDSDQVALHSHDSARPLAKRGRGLTLAEDDEGLRVEIDLPDTTDGRDLLAQVRAGLIDAMSFGFTVREDVIERGEDRDVRTLKDVRLVEVSAVLWPAYPDTSLAVRSLEAATKNENPPAEGGEGGETNHPDLTCNQLWERRLATLTKSPAYNAS
jgi:uncharacterized protein